MTVILCENRVFGHSSLRGIKTIEKILFIKMQKRARSVSRLFFSVSLGYFCKKGRVYSLCLFREGMRLGQKEPGGFCITPEGVFNECVLLRWMGIILRRGMALARFCI